VVCGAKTDACVLSTLFGGFVRGYDMTLVGDAHTTADRPADASPQAGAVIATVNNLWQRRTAPARTADVADAAAVQQLFSTGSL
jgi:nicotinamidase-related amidase